MVKKWIGEFKWGRTSTNDAERSGRSKDVTTPEIIKKIYDIVLDDPKVKVHQLAEAADISIGLVVKILHHDLRMRKLTVKWVPRLLKIDQKRQRIRYSKNCLDFFNGNLSVLLRRLVTIDETWIHHYTLESKKQEKQWVGPSITAPKQAKTQQSAGKVMAFVFWDSCGILFIECFGKRKKLNSDYERA